MNTFDLEAERAMLGSVLLDPDTLPFVRRNIQTKDLYRESHSWIYTAMCELYDAGQPIDFFLLQDELKRHGHEGDCPPSELTSLLENTPTSLYAEHYAGIVAQHSKRRRQIALAQKLVEKAEEGEDPDDVDAWLLAEVTGSRTPAPALLSWQSSFELMQQLQQQYGSQQYRDALNRWAWPWASWNKIVDPIEPGILMTIMAGDGVGKTTVAECIAEHWARKGNRVVYVHFELNRNLMLERRLSRNASVTRRTIITDMLTDNQRLAIDTAERFMMGWDGSIQYLHTPGWSIESVVTELATLQRQGECDAVIVDYLEKAQASLRQAKLYGHNVTSREADDVNQLKNFAEQQGVRTVMLSQFNKAGKETRFESLSRTDGRGAGQKTEFANIVVLLHKDKDDNGEYKPELNVKVDKNTLGKLGAFKQMTNGCFNVFDCDYRHE